MCLYCSKPFLWSELQSRSFWIGSNVAVYHFTIFQNSKLAFSKGLRKTFSRTIKIWQVRTCHSVSHFGSVFDHGSDLYPTSAKCSHCMFTANHCETWSSDHITVLCHRWIRLCPQRTQSHFENCDWLVYCVLKNAISFEPYILLSSFPTVWWQF